MPDASRLLSRRPFVDRIVFVLVVLTAALTVAMAAMGNGVAAGAFGLVSVLGLAQLALSRVLGLEATLQVHLPPLILTAAMVLLATLNGFGVRAPVLMALPLIPVLAFYLGGRGPGLVWLGVSLVLPTGLYLADSWIGDPPMDEVAQLRLYLIASTTAALFLGLASYQYDRTVADREAALLEARAEAEQARGRAEEAQARAEAADEAKSRFLATMTHELRTPLGGIASVAELLEGRLQDPEALELVGLIERSGEALLALVDEVLDLARIEAGRLEVEATPFEPAVVVADVAALLRARAEAGGVALRAEVEDVGWRAGDPLRVRQIVLNLANNAVKFTSHGQVSVRLRDESGVLVLEVEDSGIGIPEDRLDHVFEAFRQADGSTARRFGGTGLGLAITRSLVEAMGGTISVRSETGRGSCFTVRLPLPPVRESLEAPEQTPLVPLEMRLLIAEDNPVNQVVLEHMADRLGCTSVLVGDGQAAVDRVRDESFDAVLMDGDMPVLDGFEAAERIRAFSDVPIVALTASVTAETRERARATGMGAFVAKPVRLRALHAVLLAAREARGGAA